MLHNAFSLHAKQNPDYLAIVAPQIQVSYSQLDIASNKLASELLSLNCKHGELIAIIMDKGWEQIVATLGILKAGSAYLPIEPSESIERLKNLISVGRVKIIITQQKYTKLYTWSKTRKIIIIDESILTKPPMLLNSPHIVDNENNLAYVIFTSGSTGVPKGVMISHKSASNTISDINQRFVVTNKDKVFAISNLVFDLSVYDIFGTLSAGGTIVIGNNSVLEDIYSWEKLFFEQQISIWNSVPALMEMFVDFLIAKNIKCPSHSLRLVLLSGDWISVTLPQKIWKFFGKGVQIVSLGGATEASIWSILYDIKKIDHNWKSIPYGKPMLNQQFFIMDEKLNPICNNECGELFIGGIGVAQDYWRNIKLSRQRFITHPIHGRIYRTGDLGRYMPDGNIEFLGRIDSQVKISGYRVELNAIRTCLIKYPFVNQAVVTSFKDKSFQKLIAYITFNDNIDKFGEKFTDDQVNNWKGIYDTLFRHELSKTRVHKLNSAGWVSSYNNNYFPKPQMLEWVNNTVEQILSLSPTSILEIGCGTGMILLNLVDKVKEYDATDISNEAILYVKKQLLHVGAKNVNLWNLEATKSNSIQKKYDVIVLNSVIQYFPNLEYFITVINQCVDMLNNNGYLYIGDVRSLNHQHEFHSSILLNKGYDTNNCIALQNLLESLVSDDSELVVDHNFFYFLKTVQQKITHVEVLLKKGAFSNEMNSFRYNVILHVNHKNKPDIPSKWVDWESSCITTDYIHNQLAKNVDYIAIRNVPNQRIIGLNDATQFLSSETWQQKCQNIILQRRQSAIDPELITTLAKEHGYYAINTWSKNANCFDTIIEKRGLNLSFDNPVVFNNVFANNPMLHKIKKHIINEIKIFLKTWLPSYMIPSHFTVLSTLPVTQNGKIDYNALPCPITILHSNVAHHVAPKNKTEKTLTKIWKNILGIHNISTNQNFLEIGGTSLLVVQLIARINKEFHINMELQNIGFTNVTIQKLARIIDRD